MYLVISLLVLMAGYGIWLYQFLIIAYLFTFTNVLSATRTRAANLATDWAIGVSVYIKWLRAFFVASQHSSKFVSTTAKELIIFPYFSNTFAKILASAYSELRTRKMLSWPTCMVWWIINRKYSIRSSPDPDLKILLEVNLNSQTLESYLPQIFPTYGPGLSTAYANMF